jgi:hypothetical protein
MDDKTYEDRVIKLTDLVGDDGILEGFAFLGCQIKGPAVLVSQDSTMVDCSFGTPNVEAILWEVPLSRPVVLGVVAAVNCTFERCTFLNVGLAGPPDEIRKMRQQLS